METFGERVRRLRKARGISVTLLARRVGVSEGAIRQIENGQTKQASFDTGLRLADILQVSPAELAWGTLPGLGPSPPSDLPVIPGDDRLQSLESAVDRQTQQIDILEPTPTRIALLAQQIATLTEAVRQAGIPVPDSDIGAPSS